ncbi:hypothetical protein KKC1_18180, partial [Calderihabitans maritimus]
MARERLQPAA